MGTLLRSGDQVRAVAQLVEAPERQAADVAHGAGARSATCFACRTTSPGASPRRCRCRSAGRRPPRATRRRIRRPMSSTCAPTSWPGPTRGWGRRGSCTRSQWTAIPASRRRGRAWAGATASSASSLTARPAARAARRRRFDRALALNPGLAIAHKFYANLEADIGLATRAMVRLLEQASRHGNDPELFAGLVHALRYCGLFEQSIVAHDEARRLDPNVPTSVEQTVMMTGDVDRLLAMAPSSTVGSATRASASSASASQAAATRRGSGWPRWRRHRACTRSRPGKPTSRPGSTSGWTTCEPGTPLWAA